MAWVPAERFKVRIRGKKRRGMSGTISSFADNSQHFVAKYLVTEGSMGKAQNPLSWGK